MDERQSKTDCDGAKPTGAFPWVAPMMMNRNIIVRMTSDRKPEKSVYFPGE